jgi:hypothetical protein
MQVGFARFNMNGIKKVKTIIPNQERKRNLTKTTLS